MKRNLFDEITEGFETLIKWRAGKANHPGCLQSVDGDFVQRLQALVGNTDVDLDAALLSDDE